jgi:hypothetical protein
VAVEGQLLADFRIPGTAEVVGIVQRSDPALKQHRVVVVVAHTTLKDLVVGAAVGTDRQVAAEDRRHPVVRCTTPASIWVVDRHCTRVVRIRVGPN